MRHKAYFFNGCGTRLGQRAWQAVIVVGIVLLTAGGYTPMEQAHAEAAPPVVVIHAKRFAFVPSQITLEAGKTVRLVFITDDVPHSIAVPELGIDMLIRRLRSNQIVITPASAGNFAGECTRYCGADHDRMRFVIHVVR